MNETRPTYRRYRDGDDKPPRWQEQIFEQDTSFKCPTYVHRTPPCQGSCPSGEDIRGWLQIARGMEKPPGEMTWQEYAFRRSTDANPFPSMMGRVCPAPCQEGCNRNELEDFVGINSVEQFIGDHALAAGFTFARPEVETGKRVAIIGGGVAGMACAYQLRRKGHACTVFEMRADLGGMARYGIPGYRTPRETLTGEFQRIVDMGVELRLNTRVGRDVTLEQLQREFDAVLIAVGAQAGQPLPVPGADVSNCISGVAFLAAFNEGRLKAAAQRVLVVGGGDTAMDVVSVARRLGHIRNAHESDRPEYIILNQTAQDVASAARRDGADVTLVYRRPIEKMPAAKHEVEAAEHEGVKLLGSLAPVAVVKGEDGRARALRVIEVDWSSGKMKEKPGTERDIECDLIVAAIGQAGDLEGMESLNNGKGLISADSLYRVPGHPGLFVAGDVVKPHLLTTAIGQASVAAESIHLHVMGAEPGKRPKVDVHHFNLLNKLREWKLEPNAYGREQVWGTDSARFAIHNYEDRSRQEVIPADELYLGHFEFALRHQRAMVDVNAENVLGHFEERHLGLDEKNVRDEAKRCMSCGMCFECDNCVIFCPQTAVKRVPKKEATTGRYVYTDYTRCIGCHICADVCPTGYIDMGLGE